MIGEPRYEIVTASGIALLTREQLDKRFGETKLETGRHLRSELQNQPVLPRLIGPMWGGWRDADGEHVFLKGDGTRQPYSQDKGPIAHTVIRYETQEVYDVLSR